MVENLQDSLKKDPFIPNPNLLKVAAFLIKYEIVKI